MANSLVIGRIFGIKVELHWTFILLLLLSLLLSTFFLIIIILLFVCVLIHELAHSVTATRNKVRVKSIILLPIGGASVIDDTKIPAKVEFNIALAGPVMSFVLAAIFGLAAIFTPPGEITFLMQNLFVLNAFLGIFNILPAFPMDGGRVFRSYLQKRMSYFDATMLTAKVSKAIMALIVIATVIFAIFASAYSADYREFLVFWSLIIVFFLYGGVQQEAQLVTLRRNTKGMRVLDAASKNYLSVDQNMPLPKLYLAMKRSKQHIVITKMGSRYLLVDVFKRAKGKAEIVKDIAVQIPEVSSATGIMDAISKMQSSDSSMVAIVSGGKLVGIATASMMEAFVTMHIASRK
ncbi:MAG: hypothetical protein KGH65_03575 [Candidatus Micrarchaeota archaeon]|nr:hypothetical protein [Candidatus Micrarchaeota archaeon]